MTTFGEYQQNVAAAACAIRFRIVALRIGSAIQVARSDLARYIGQSGLPDTALPEPSTARSKAIRARREFELEVKRLAPESTLEEWRLNPDKSTDVWDWRVKTDEAFQGFDGNTYVRPGAEIPLRIVYHRKTGALRVHSEEANRLRSEYAEHRANGVVLDPKTGVAVPFSPYQAATRVGELDQIVRKAQADLDALVAKYDDAMTDQDLRNYLYDLIRRQAQGISFKAPDEEHGSRGAGGVFIVPGRNLPIMDQIESVVTLIGQGCYVTRASFPEVSDPAVKQQQDQDIASILQSYRDSFRLAITKRQELLEKHRTGDSQTRESTVENLDDALLELEDQVRSFGELFQFEAQDYTEFTAQIQQARAEVDVFKQEVARKRVSEKRGKKEN